MRGPSPLEQSQKQLYLAVKKELNSFERAKQKDLAAYERSFKAHLPKTFKTSDRGALLKAAKQAAVILVGDFHPFRQSQKGFLRLVVGSAEYSKKLAIALECFQQSHQGALEEYRAGLITAEELRDKIDFERHWPFPWESYQEILAFARDSGFPVIALNVRERALHRRDAAAAERIKSFREKNPDTKVLALYGELHLGKSHLPAALRRALGGEAKVLTIHQNIPEIYWKAPTLGDGQKPEVLALGKNEFCVLNSVPWVKLRSYLDWLEGSSAEEEAEDLDVAGLVHHYAFRLTEALELRTRLDQAVEIFPPDRLDRKSPSANKSPDRELAAHSREFARTGYLPRAATLMLPAVSTNSLSEAAAHLLRHSQCPPPSRGKKWASPEWTSHFLLGYLGSKILNPKRKCNEVKDLLHLAARKSQFRKAQRQSEIASRALAIAGEYLAIPGPRKRKSKLPGPSELEACRSAGFLLGERYFLALLRDPRLFSHARTLFELPGGLRILREVRARIRKSKASVPGKLERF